MPTIAEKYSLFAPLYDLLSAEYPVYHAGRRLGADSLGLREGGQVLDLGCGTGLNFPLLQRAVGPGGSIIGIDRSAQMLAQARRRADRQGWANVTLLQADATTLDPLAIARRIEAAGGHALSDAALATYALSLMTPWRRAWSGMLGLTRPGGRLSVVDMQDPTGRSAVLTPLARLACRLGGADITAHPWQGVEQDCDDVAHFSARGGHLQVRTGSRPGPGRPGGSWAAAPDGTSGRQ